MGTINGTGERLRRATQLWHAYLAARSERFELAQFLNDASVEKRVIEAALAGGDAKLAILAKEWLRDTGQGVSAPAAAPVRAAPTAPAAVDPPKKQRYLKGVR
jgi:hypothetical protein